MAKATPGATELGPCNDELVQDISIVTSRLPTVYRPEASRTVFLTFEGLRESRTASDRLTRVRVAMPATLIQHLRDLLDGIPAE